MIKITGLWKNTSKSTGKQFIAGSANSTCRYLILPNSHKSEGDNQPDFILYMTENTRKETSTGPSFDLSGGKSPKQTTQNKPFSNPETKSEQASTEEDVQF